MNKKGLLGVIIFAVLIVIISSVVTLITKGYLFVGDVWHETVEEALSYAADNPTNDRMTLTVKKLLDQREIGDITEMFFVSENDTLTKVAFVTKCKDFSKNPKVFKNDTKILFSSDNPNIIPKVIKSIAITVTVSLFLGVNILTTLCFFLKDKSPIADTADNGAQLYDSTLTNIKFLSKNEKLNQNKNPTVISTIG